MAYLDLQLYILQSFELTLTIRGISVKTSEKNEGI